MVASRFPQGRLPLQQIYGQASSARPAHSYIPKQHDAIVFGPFTLEPGLTIVSRESADGPSYVHGDFHGKQQKAVTISNPDADVRGVALPQSILADLSRSAGSLVFGEREAFIIEAYLIAGGIISYGHIEIEPRHRICSWVAWALPTRAGASCSGESRVHLGV